MKTLYRFLKRSFHFQETKEIFKAKCSHLCYSDFKKNHILMRNFSSIFEKNPFRKQQRVNISILKYV